MAQNDDRPLHHPARAPAGRGGLCRNLPLGESAFRRYASVMAKKNPLKLNALQLRTLVILQQMARSPNHAQPGDEEGSIFVSNFPAAHGNHFHIGDAVVSARDASGLANANVFTILERKGLLRSMHPMGALLSAAALAYDTGIDSQVLHRSDH
jgi:hypothetical protein